MSSIPQHVGIDVAQATLACCLRLGERHVTRQVANTTDGFAQLTAWLTQHGAPTPAVLLEATGGYEEAVATWCYDRGCTVSIVNPYRVKKWAESELQRTKTDPVDAKLLAEFAARARKLHPWAPVPLAYRTLQQYVRARLALQATVQEYRNRLQAPGCTAPLATVYQHVLDDLTRQLAALTEQLHQHIRTTPDLWSPYRLLLSIPGIGETTAALLLGEIGTASQFHESGQLVAWAGLSVQEGRSGTSVYQKPRISKRGAPRVRHALYFPAMAAVRCNPHLAQFAARLKARGKAAKQILCAVMRKLLELVFAVLRRGQPFDPQYAKRTPATA